MQYFLLVTTALFYVNLGKMNALLSTNGITTNFYRRLFYTYRKLNGLVYSSTNISGREKHLELVKKFKVYGVFLILSLLVYPVIALFLIVH
mgnify:FL=1